MRVLRCLAGVVGCFLCFGSVFAEQPRENCKAKARPVLHAGPSYEEFSADSALELLQKKAVKVSKQAQEPHWPNTEMTSTTSTTTTTIVGPEFMIISSGVTGSIYYWDFVSEDASVLVEFAGHDPKGIAVDLNLGYLYYAEPILRQIIRYELEIRDGKLKLYDQQPVIIAQNIDAEWIDVNEFSNIFWTDPVAHAIHKMYFNTVQKVATGQFQPNQLDLVSYMDVYLELGRVPSICYDALVEFPANCSTDISCSACQDLGLSPYVYTLYTNVGVASGMQVQPGNRMLWGHRYDGFQLGTVVEALNEPMLAPGQTEFKIDIITDVWDMVSNFYMMPRTGMGENNLFITTNGTLGIPPIPGDVVGALLGITPNHTHGDPSTQPHGRSTVVPMVTEGLTNPVSMVWNGHETLYIADSWGIKSVNSGEMLENSPVSKWLKIPGAVGLARIAQGDPCYPMMNTRGSMHDPKDIGG